MLARVASGRTSEFESVWKEFADRNDEFVSRLHRRGMRLARFDLLGVLGWGFLGGQPELVVDLLRDFLASRLECAERRASLASFVGSAEPLALVNAGDQQSPNGSATAKPFFYEVPASHNRSFHTRVDL
jgi:hypothetical protein